MLMLVVAFVNCFVLCSAASPPNFILFLTDDQDLLLNGMDPMRKTVKLIGNEGVTFTNAFVNTPICCPSRSTILTGKFIHNTGVVNNSLSGNCAGESWQANHEPHSIAAILKNERAYSGFYAGKYLNQYGYKKSGGLSHIPPGYDWWIGLQGNSKYYNYTLSVNGTRRFYKNKYLTDLIIYTVKAETFQKKFALDFLNQLHVAHTPFFMMLSPPASHAPFTPAPRHRHKFPRVTAVRNPAFNFSSTDKHWVIQMPPKHLPENASVLDGIQRSRLQTLLAVDEMVEAVVSKLKQLDVLDNTYLLYTSDNGFHIGQFTQPWDKRQPYESDIRVPFLMRGPGIESKSVSAKPISTVDLAPTIIDLAGIPQTYNMDGRSFKRHLKKSSNAGFGTTDIFIEYYGEGDANTVDPQCFSDSPDLSQCTTDNWCKCQDSWNNTYVCVRRLSRKLDYKYCLFSDDLNYVEVYDLKNDPYELVNLQKNVTDHEHTYYKNLLRNYLVKL